MTDDPFHETLLGWLGVLVNIFLYSFNNKIQECLKPRLQDINRVRVELHVTNVEHLSLNRNQMCKY